jgi:hypothetical protein
MSNNQPYTHIIVILKIDILHSEYFSQKFWDMHRSTKVSSHKMLYCLIADSIPMGPKLKICASKWTTTISQQNLEQDYRNLFKRCHNYFRNRKWRKILKLLRNDEVSPTHRTCHCENYFRRAVMSMTPQFLNLPDTTTRCTRQRKYPTDTPWYTTPLYRAS